MALWIPIAWPALGVSVPLTGTVEDSDGRPVAGATVRLGDTHSTRNGAQVIATVETDEQGRFRLDLRRVEQLPPFRRPERLAVLDN